MFKVFLAISEKIRQFKITLFRKGYKKNVTADMVKIVFSHTYTNSLEQRLDVIFYRKYLVKKLNPIFRKYLINTAQTTQMFDFEVRLSFSAIKNSKLSTQEFQFWFDIPFNNYQSGNFLFKLPNGSFTNLLFNYKPNENAINKKDDLNHRTNKFIKILNKISEKDIYLHIYSGIYFPDDHLRLGMNTIEKNNRLLSPEAKMIGQKVSIYYKYLHDNNLIVKDYLLNKILMLNFIISKDITWTLSYFDYSKGTFDNFDTYPLNYNENWQLLTQFVKCQSIDTIVLEQEITKDNYDEIIEVLKALAY